MAASSRARQPPRQTVTTRSTVKTSPMPIQNGNHDPVSRGERHDHDQQQVADERDDAVADAELLRPVAEGLRAQAVRAEVLQRAALPAQALRPQRPPGRHHLGDDRALRRRDHQGAERLEREGQLVVLGERDGVVDVAGHARESPAALGGDRAQRARAEDRRGAGEHEHPAAAAARCRGRSGCTRCAGTGRAARRPPRRRTARRPPSARGRRSAGGGGLEEAVRRASVSASITITHVVVAQRRAGRPRERLVEAAGLLVGVARPSRTTSTPAVAGDVRRWRRCSCRRRRRPAPGGSDCASSEARVVGDAGLPRCGPGSAP